jgi:hypothetical protein
VDNRGNTVGFIPKNDLKFVAVTFPADYAKPATLIDFDDGGER